MQGPWSEPMSNDGARSGFNIHGATPQDAGLNNNGAETDVLIPRLPNELAAQCIAILPWSSITAARRVCRAWRRLVDGPQFPILRKQMGRIEGWICVLPKYPIGETFMTFSPQLNKWLALPLISKQHSTECWEGFSCVSVDHKMYVMGGIHLSHGTILEDNTGPCNDVLVFNAYTNQWSKAANMNFARSWFSSAVLGNQIYVAGGRGKSCFLDSAEVYDMHNDTWQIIPSMNVARTSSPSVILNSQFWVVGGEFVRHQFGTQPPKFSAEFYDPSSGKWSLLPEMGYSTQKVPGPCTVHKNKLISIQHNRILAYVLDEIKWVHIGNILMLDGFSSSVPCVRCGFALETLESKLYIIGGMLISRSSARSNRYLNSLLVCDLDSLSDSRQLCWREVASMGARCGSILASCVLYV